MKKEHKVKMIGTRGNLLLVECKNCLQRALARDKEEVEKIYNMMECAK